MAGTTYLVRLVPMLLVKGRITNRFIRSFLYYLPYTVLAAMTFPAILFATDSVISGAFALIVCVVLAYFRHSLITVAAGGAISALIAELIIGLLAA